MGEYPAIAAEMIFGHMRSELIDTGLTGTGVELQLLWLKHKIRKKRTAPAAMEQLHRIADVISSASN